MTNDASVLFTRAGGENNPMIHPSVPKAGWSIQPGIRYNKHGIIVPLARAETYIIADVGLKPPGLSQDSTD